MYEIDVGTRTRISSNKTKRNYRTKIKTIIIIKKIKIDKREEMLLCVVVEQIFQIGQCNGILFDTDGAL